MEQEQEVDLRAYWRIVQHWLWLILLAVFVAGGTSFGVSRWVARPVYRASTRLLVQPSTSTAAVNYTDILAGERIAQTYAQLLGSESIREEALQRLGVAEPSTNGFSVRVQRPRDTQLLDLQVESTDPVLAARLANTIAQVFVEESRERQEARFAASKRALEQQIGEIEQEIAQVQAQLPQAAEDERTRLETRFTQLRDILARLQSSYESVRLAEAQSLDVIDIIEPAQVPEVPVKPRVLQNTLLAAVLGGMVGLGVAFLIEYLDTSVHTPEQAEAATGSPLLGQIWDAPALSGISSDGNRFFVEQARSPTAEAFRTLRANLYFSSVDQPLRRILVTSPLPEEGKTIVAVNLAAALALSGKRVILVDADLRKPAVGRYTGLERTPGLSEALFDAPERLASYLQPVEAVENLYVLPAGALPPNPNELLASRRMGELLDTLAGMADVLLLDSPPVLAVADALVLAERADGVLLVLEAGQTDRRAATAAAEQLRRTGCRLLGTVLNKVPLPGQRGAYYHYKYYYYYRYYDYYASGSERSRSRMPRWWPFGKKGKKRRRRRVSYSGTGAAERRD